MKPGGHHNVLFLLMVVVVDVAVVVNCVVGVGVVVVIVLVVVPFSCLPDLGPKYVSETLTIFSLFLQ